MIMKIHKKSLEEKSQGYLFWFIAVLAFLVILTIALLAFAYLIFNCSDIQDFFKGNNEYRKVIDDDEVKLQWYLLESKYYFDDIDKEEMKLSSAAKDYRLARKYAELVEPKCVMKITPRERIMKEYQDLEAMAVNSIKYFRQVLTNWSENIDYTDIDKSLFSLLNQYQDIYFNPGEWKEDKVNQRWTRIKYFYSSAIKQLEKCTIPYNIPQDDLDKLQFVREQISFTESELEEKLEKLKNLSEELLKKANIVLEKNVQCLYNFPEKWLLIQYEQAQAESEIEIIKLKLRQVRYKLMLVNSSKQLNDIVEWEDNFSKAKSDRFKFYIDNHYEKAGVLQNDLIESISKCSSA